MSDVPHGFTAGRAGGEDAQDSAGASRFSAADAQLVLQCGGDRAVFRLAVEGAGHQPEITPDTLQNFAQRFATEHKVDLPFVVDPQGKFAAEVNADKELGKKIGIQHTPTIYIVSSRNPSRPFVEVTDTSKLFEMIEAMQTE
jgi:hypothetical protein